MRPITRGEWNALGNREREAAQKATDLERTARRIQQAEVAMGRLTGDKNWDAYLGMLQAKMEADQKQIDSIEALLSGTDYIDEESLKKFRHEVLVLRARIQTRLEDIELPGQIVKKIAS